MTYEAVLTQLAHDNACDFLLRHVVAGQLQEDLCFALWRPATGTTRKTALIFDILTPNKGEHHLHGNASFEPDYLSRAVRTAYTQNAGLAFIHNHLSDGWQGMSGQDVIAERDRISPPARATGLPLVGLTLGTDRSWSARFWIWDGQRFNRSWCDKVRVVGRRLRITYRDPGPPPRRSVLCRTIDTWGEECQRKISGLRIGIVGVGSVGCLIAETLARIGVENLVLIDPDKVEPHNLDRLLYAGIGDVGQFKVNLAARNLRNSATAANFDVRTYPEPIQGEHAYLAALDCDLLFSAVDRPLPKDLLNHIAYAHCIPVISGGVFIDNKPNGTLGQAAWSTVTVGPEYRCLRCDGQYTSSDVIQDVDGSLDDPVYIRRLMLQGQPPANQNVFPFSANLASFMVIEMVRFVIGENWWPDKGGKLHYSLIPSRLSTERQTCGINCSVKENIALGDRYRCPFIIQSVKPRKSIWSRIFCGSLYENVSAFMRKIGRRS